jgi:kynurenine formamidase
MWNGYPASDVTAWDGAKRNAIKQLSNRVITRGVLLDVPRLRGVDALPTDYAISSDDLEACIAAQGPTSEVRQGDAVLVRTGHLDRSLKADWQGFADGDAPGLSFRSLGWIHRKGISALATDTYAVEVLPSDLVGGFYPFHQVAIPNIGLLLGEIFDLEELARACAESGVYEFLFVACPLPVSGGIGSPINPIAIL